MKPRISNRLLRSFISVLRYSFAGLHQASWLRGFIILAILLPAFGFISQDVHLADHPFYLFMGFQYGLQRYLLLIFSWVTLRKIWQYDETSGMQAALKAAGVSPFAHLLAKHLTIATLILGFQLLLTGYCGLLTLVWKADPTLTSATISLSMGTWSDLFAWGWANALLMIITISLIRWCWMLTEQLLLGYIAGNLVLMAGLTRPVWIPYFSNSPDLPMFFQSFGTLLSTLVPQLWQFDLWWIHQEQPHLSLPSFTFNLTAVALFWILIIHFASWFVSRFKRT